MCALQHCKYLHLHYKYWHLHLQVLACYIASTGTCKYLHLQYNTKNTTFSTDNYAAILIQANAQADMRAIELPLHMTRAQRVPNTRPLPNIIFDTRPSFGNHQVSGNPKYQVYPMFQVYPTFQVKLKYQVYPKCTKYPVEIPDIPGNT